MHDLAAGKVDCLAGDLPSLVACHPYHGEGNLIGLNNPLLWERAGNVDPMHRQRGRCGVQFLGYQIKMELLGSRRRMELVLSVERNGPVAVATISRPPANALNDELVSRLEAVLEEVAKDETVSVLHLRTDLKIFCGGADLAFMQTCFSTPEGPDAMLELVRRLQRLFDRMETTPVVLIAEIGGAALGGGMELALACDLRVAANEAKLGLPEVHLGLIPGAGGTQRLARLCGLGVARRLIFGAEVVSGAEAERLGMVTWAQPRAQLAEWTRDLAARMGGMSRAALAAAKSCIAAQGQTGRDGFAEEIAATRRLYFDPDTRRKVSKFLERSAT